MIQKLPDSDGTRPPRKRSGKKSSGGESGPVARRGVRQALEDQDQVEAAGDEPDAELDAELSAPVEGSSDVPSDPGSDADADDDGPADDLAAEDTAAEDAAAEDAAAEDAADEDAADAPVADALPPDGDGDGLPLALRVEALIFAVSQPIAPIRLARLLGVDLELVKQALEQLVERWKGRETAMELVAIAGGYRFMTRPAFHANLAALSKKARTENLSPAALETLAVVAYRQPLCRADIEGIRGVAAGPLLRVLLDRDLIRIAGRSPEPGHPLLYGTTKRFLDHFGLKSLKQLPDIKDLLDVR
jgi:segregation and condensation protein B